jgi:arsenate reductase
VDIEIYHNPECGTSRNVLAIIKAAGDTPTVFEYLKTGWTKPQLLGLFAAAGLMPCTALRETKSPAAELGLLDGAGRARRCCVYQRRGTPARS